MSVAEESIKNAAAVSEKAKSQTAKKPQPIINRILDVLSSVRFGVVLLINTVVV